MSETSSGELVVSEPEWMRGRCECYPAGEMFGPEPANAAMCPQHGMEADAWRAGVRDALAALRASVGMLPWHVGGSEKIRTHTDRSGRTIRETWRQIGWVGQTGTPYALGDKAGVHGEPGGFAPLWLLAHADEVEPLDEDGRR